MILLVEQATFPHTIVTRWLRRHCVSTLGWMSIAILAGISAVQPVAAQEVFFRSDFEFDGETGIPLVAVSGLNDMDGLVGTWTGSDVEFPAGDASGFWTPDSSGITANPREGNLLFIDRPIADHTLFANLTETVQHIGANVSFVAGTRRTGGAGAKDYDIFGVDGDGNESFRIRVGTDGTTERLGFVHNDEVTFDLPTVVGEDLPDDIANTGGPPFAVDDDIVAIAVQLGSAGYSVSLENRNGSNSYVTATLPYNGTASEIAQVGFAYQGVEGNTVEQSGFFLDSILVTGFKELLAGDFDGNGQIDAMDFDVMAMNFNAPGDISAGDMDFNGQVDLHDFLMWRTVFDAPAAAAVPEPKSLGLLGVGVLIMAIGQRNRRTQLKR